MPEVVITLEPDPPDLDIIEEEGGGMEEDPLGDVADANTEAPQIVEEEGADIMEEEDPLDDVVDANTEAPQGNFTQMEAGISQLSKPLAQARASQVDISNEIL